MPYAWPNDPVAGDDLTARDLVGVIYQAMDERRLVQTNLGTVADPPIGDLWANPAPSDLVTPRWAKITELLEAIVNLPNGKWGRSFTSPTVYEEYNEYTYLVDAGFSVSPGALISNSWTTTYPKEFSTLASTEYVRADPAVAVPFVNGDKARCLADSKIYNRVAGAWVVDAEPFTTLPSTHTLKRRFGYNARGYLNIQVAAEAIDLIRVPVRILLSYPPVDFARPTNLAADTVSRGSSTFQYATHMANVAAAWPTNVNSSSGAFYRVASVGNLGFVTNPYGASWQVDPRFVFSLANQGGISRRLIHHIHLAVPGQGTIEDSFDAQGSGYSQGWNSQNTTGAGELTLTWGTSIPASLTWPTSVPPNGDGINLSTKGAVERGPFTGGGAQVTNMRQGVIGDFGFAYP